MALFRNFFGGVADEKEDDGAEIVEQLVERLDTVDAEDRRDALRALRSMVKKMRVAVGSMGMNAFMEILDKDRTNYELLALDLDLLNALLSNSDETTDDDELGERFAEVMLKRKQFMTNVISSVIIYDFTVKRSAIQLLTSLLRHRGPEVQHAITGEPNGVTDLLDCIHDNREIIRNDAILMLCELSRNNSQIQQLIAYDNGFTSVLDVIQIEPIDSIVVEDCLFVLLNLLRKNSINQQSFRESNMIVRLNDILDAFLHGTDETETGDWSKQRTANVIFLLQVIRSLVSTDNANNRHAAQRAIHQCKMLTSLCRILLSEMGVSVEVLTETVIAVAECIRGNYANQEFFASCSMTTNEHTVRPALLVLLLSVTAEKQPFKLRCAVCYCFLAYLHDNEFGKTKIIETLLSTDPDAGMTTGAMICQALTATESVQCWFGAVLLLHCLMDVPHLRGQLLRVHLTVTVDQPAVSLLDHIASQLISYGNRRVQARAALLMLLSVWLTECPAAVVAFCANSDNISYLSSHIVEECGEGTESEQHVLKGLMAFLLLTCLHGTSDTAAAKTMEHMLERRIGRDVLVGALEGLSRTEQFVRAAQKPQPLAKVPQELFLDFLFIKLYKQNEGSLVKLIRGGEFNSSSNTDNIIQSFKELIKRQDEEISELKADMKRMSAESSLLRSQLEDKTIENQLEETRRQLEQARMSSHQNEAAQLQIQEMQRVNQQWQSEVEKYKAWAAQWQQYQLAQLPNPNDPVIAQLQQQVAHLEQQLSYGYEAFEQQSQKLIEATAQVEQYKEKAERATVEAASSVPLQSNGVKAQDDELERLKSDQEDLLVLLADQHNKITSYRHRLRELNQPISDDED